ncbi:uncharacterized protein LOC111350810 isoform X3 [Spodoptera litura]|nr:uncharacterized protein LOC111350810 isoform X3 [Spodoptera litura]XP_022818276.1 uncharacterized protein LOC111350810 isoform X3 [Spodoptera litura]
MPSLRLLSVRTLTASSSVWWHSRAACSVLRTTVSGRRLASRMLTQVTETNITRLDRWKRIQFIRQHFWNRFHIEYISLLQAKSKWFHSRGEVKPGSLVLIKDKTAPPLLWSLGRVTMTYPGVDGVTRVAEIKTKKGTIRRGFNSICPLPIQD